MLRKELSTSGWEAQGRLPGRSGIPQAFAAGIAFEPAEMGMGEGESNPVRRQHEQLLEWGGWWARSTGVLCLESEGFSKHM